MHGGALWQVKPLADVRWCPVTGEVKRQPIRPCTADGVEAYQEAVLVRLDR